MSSRSTTTPSFTCSVLAGTDDLNGVLAQAAHAERETLSVHGELLDAIERTAQALGAEPAT